MCLQNAKRGLLYSAAWTVHQRTGIDKYNMCVFISDHIKWWANVHKRVQKSMASRPRYRLPFANGSQNIRVAVSQKHSTRSSSVTSALFPAARSIMVSPTWMERCWTLPATPSRVNDEKVPFSRGTTEIEWLQKPFCHINIRTSRRNSLLP